MFSDFKSDNKTAQEDKNQKNHLVERAIQALKKEYVLVGKTHVRVWHAWLMLGIIAGAISGIILVANRSGEFEAGKAALTSQPNIIFILADDLNDFRSTSRPYYPADLWSRVMPNVQAYLASQGTSFINSFVSMDACCPSRATWLTGQYTHNHGVWTSYGANGGYDKLVNSGISTLGQWLQSGGYKTFHVGKYLNEYPPNPCQEGDTACMTKFNTGQPCEVPPGWNEFYGGVEETTNVDNETLYYFYDYRLCEKSAGDTAGRYVFYSGGNQNGIPTRPENYKTDVYFRKAADIINRASAAGTPFFLSIATLAPVGDQDAYHGEPTPAEEDFGTYGSESLPKAPNYNEQDMSDKPAAMKLLPLISASTEAAIVSHYRNQLESLRSVDRGIAAIVSALQAAGKLENTVIILTSDHGQFLGEHRFYAGMHGKVLVYDEGLRTPLLIRAPGIAQGQTIKNMAVNVDLAPTILDFAGVSQSARVMDGKSLKALMQNPAMSWRSDFLIEGYNQVYWGVRNEQYKYVEHKNGEKEFYDLVADPYELTSQHNSTDPAKQAVMAQLRDRMNQLKTCNGSNCFSITAGGPSCSLSFSPTSVNAGQNTTVSWTSSNDADNSLPLYCNGTFTANLSPANGSTTFVPPYSGTCTATAQNSSGQSATCSASITVSGASTDTTKPIVSITSPLNGAQVSRNTYITITANASDNKGVTKVEFRVDGILKCTDTSAPYTCSWQTPLLAGQTRKLGAKAYDAAGNVGTSAVVSVTTK